MEQLCGHLLLPCGQLHRCGRHDQVRFTRRHRDSNISTRVISRPYCVHNVLLPAHAAGCSTFARHAIGTISPSTRCGLTVWLQGSHACSSAHLDHLVCGLVCALCLCVACGGGAGAATWFLVIGGGMSYFSTPEPWGPPHVRWAVHINVKAILPLQVRHISSFHLLS